MNEDFNKKIIEDFGLSKINFGNQQKMIEKIGTLLFEAVIEKSVDVMDSQTINDFENILAEAGDDYQKVIFFLKERVVGFDEIVSDELSRLRRTTSGIFA